MMRDENDHNKWIVRGKAVPEDEAPYHRIGAWDFNTAKKVLDYSVANDVTMRAALQALYWSGEPDLLLEHVEKAKASTSTTYLRELRLKVNVEYLVLPHTPSLQNMLTAAVKEKLASLVQAGVMKDYRVTFDA
jgi:hypothetical protein